MIGPSITSTYVRSIRENYTTTRGETRPKQIGGEFRPTCVAGALFVCCCTCMRGVFCMLEIGLRAILSRYVPPRPPGNISPVPTIGYSAYHKRWHGIDPF